MRQIQILRSLNCVIALAVLLSSLSLVSTAAAQTQKPDSDPPANAPSQAAPDKSNSGTFTIPEPGPIVPNYPVTPPVRNRRLDPRHITSGPKVPEPAATPGSRGPATGTTPPFNRGNVYTPSNPVTAPPRKSGVNPIAGSGARVSHKNGARIIRVHDVRGEITIVDHPQTGIDIEIFKQYGHGELAALKAKLPGLADYIEMFPTEMDNSEIRLSIGLKSKYSAMTPEQLRSEHPGAYQIYRRYTQNLDPQQNNRNQPQDGSKGSRTVN